MDDEIRLVVGLGNPGREYEATRHNIGFQVADQFAAVKEARWQVAAKFEAQIAELRQAGRKIVLAKPTTYMNLSGRACMALAHWYKIQSRQMLVVVDDADLELGRLRLRLQGSSGGHNGLKSISECFGGEQFPRLRVGIGRPADQRRPEEQNPLVDFVLGKFRKEERAVVDETIDRAVNAIACAIDDGVTAAMNTYNS